MKFHIAKMPLAYTFIAIGALLSAFVHTNWAALGLVAIYFAWRWHELNIAIAWDSVSVDLHPIEEDA